MSPFCVRWPFILLSLALFLNIILAIEITHPNGETTYSESPFDITWTIALEDSDLDKIKIYLTSYKSPNTVLVQMLWTTVDANSTRAQVNRQLEDVPKGDHWRWTFFDSSLDLLDASLARSAEFQIKDASLSAQLPSSLGSTPSNSSSLSIPSTTSPTETQTAARSKSSASIAEPTHSIDSGSDTLTSGTGLPHSTAQSDDTVQPGLSVGAATGIGVGVTCTLFILCAAVCHIKASRRCAAKAKAAAVQQPEEGVYEYEFGKAVSVDISRHTSVMGGANAVGQIGRGKRVEQLQRCPTVRMGTGQKLSSEIPR